jgi:hypothetical protein
MALVARGSLSAFAHQYVAARSIMKKPNDASLLARLVGELEETPP